MTGSKLFIASCAFLFVSALSWSQDFMGPEVCSACHAEEHADWQGSLHSKAYASGTFQKAWENENKKPACLACHTTGQKPGTANYAFPGVTCESCHGPMADGHPGEGKMPIPASSEMCRTCHKKTYQEWKVSKHGQKNIRCFDCHNVHQQGLRSGGGDSLCGACHSERMKGFAHATHHLEGLQCNSCHMPRDASHEGMIEGAGSAGHTLAVGPDVCGRCHAETVHKSTQLTDLREKVSKLNKELNLAGVKDVFALKEESSDLKWKLQRAHQSLWLALLLGILGGAALGWLGCWYALGGKKSHDGKK